MLIYKYYIKIGENLRKNYWEFQVALVDTLLNISEISKTCIIICEIELYLLWIPTLITFRTVNMTWFQHIICLTNSVTST